MVTRITPGMFSNRLSYIFNVYNVHTLEEIAEAVWDRWKSVPNCGVLSLAEIERVLAEYNLNLKDSPTENKQQKMFIENKKLEKLRDEFAVAALQGFLSNPKLLPEILKKGGSESGWLEESAWSWADGMMKVRKRGKDAAK